MSIDPRKLERRERRLLAHESAYRVMRRTGFGMGFALLAMELIVVPYVQGDGHLTGLDHRAPLLTIALLLAVGVFGHGKVRHAESVRFHHERRRFSLCPQCGYNLKGNVDRGCPECGWRRAQ